MSNALTLTGAFALGLPISVGFAAFVQLVRWRASKYVQSIPDASEVDQEALAKERAELAKAAKKEGKVIFFGVFIGWMGFLQLLSYVSGLFLVIFMVSISILLAVMHSRAFILHLTGLGYNAFARHSNKTLVQKTIAHSNAKWLIIPCTAASAFIVLLPLLHPESTNLVFLGYFMLAATLPFQTMGETSKIGTGRSVSVKWRLYGMALFGFAVIALTVVISGIIFACIHFFGGKDQDNKPSKPISAQEKYYQKLNAEVNLFCFLPMQLAVILGMACHLLAPLYRIDWLLTNQKPGVRLQDDAHHEVEQEVFSETQAIEAITSAEIEQKDLGKVVVIPTLPQLIKRGQVGHFLARPLYTGTALLTVQLTMLGCTWSVNEVTRRWSIDLTARESGHFNGIMAIGATLILLPYILFIVLGLLSAIRGEFSLVFNHAAEWSARVAEEDVTESLLLGGEKEELMSEK